MSLVNSKTDPNDKDYWATPNEIVSGSLAYFLTKGFLPTGSKYCLDVCASEHNTKHAFYFSEKENALEQPWAFVASTNEAISKGASVDQATMVEYPVGLVAWCNPPYSRGMKEQFISKAIEQSNYGLYTIMLLPNDTSAKWFSTCVKRAKAIAFICDGRIGFINNATGERVNGNSAGSILVLFGQKDPTKAARTLYVTKQRLEKLGAENG